MPKGVPVLYIKIYKGGNIMTLYLTAKTDIDDLTIDFIEVELKSGKTVSLNWDASWITRCGNEIRADYEGVCFGEESVAGKIEQLEEMHIKEVGMYSDKFGEGQYSLSIETMEFYDGKKSLIFRNPYNFEPQNVVRSVAMQQLYDKFLASSWR